MTNIFENSDFIYMLNQAAGDRQILADQLNISPHQLSYVTHSGEGEGEGSAEGAARAGSRFQYGRKLRQYKKLERLEKKADKDAVDSIFAERMSLIRRQVPISFPDGGRSRLSKKSMPLRRQV